MPGAELYRANHLKVKQVTRDDVCMETCHSLDLSNALAEVRHWKPYALCPHCGAIPQHDCGACKGLPYVTKAVFDRCPEEKRATVLKLAPKTKE